jgi:hypothetical protein
MESKQTQILKRSLAEGIKKKQPVYFEIFTEVNKPNANLSKINSLITTSLSKKKISKLEAETLTTFTKKNLLKLSQETEKILKSAGYEIGDVLNSTYYQTNKDGHPVDRLYLYSFPNNGGEQNIVSFYTKLNELVKAEGHKIRSLPTNWEKANPSKTGPSILKKWDVDRIVAWYTSYRRLRHYTRRTLKASTRQQIKFVIPFLVCTKVKELDHNLLYKPWYSRAQNKVSYAFAKMPSVGFFSRLLIVFRAVMCMYLMSWLCSQFSVVPFLGFYVEVIVGSFLRQLFEMGRIWVMPIFTALAGACENNEDGYLGQIGVTISKLFTFANSPFIVMGGVTLTLMAVVSLFGPGFFSAILATGAGASPGIATYLSGIAGSSIKLVGSAATIMSLIQNLIDIVLAFFQGNMHAEFSSVGVGFTLVQIFDKVCDWFPETILGMDIRDTCKKLKIGKIGSLTYCLYLFCHFCNECLYWYQTYQDVTSLSFNNIVDAKKNIPCLWWINGNNSSLFYDNDGNRFSDKTLNDIKINFITKEMLNKNAGWFDIPIVKPG